MIFDGIYGHDDVKQKLADATSNNAVFHAYIFCGNSGIGKTSVARKFAKHLTGNSEPDMITVTNERYGVKKASFSVDTVRAARLDMYVKPYIADKKVFIFPKADTMTVEAQNALLTVFEEPPPYVVIILISCGERAFLPTIRSRALAIRFSPLPDLIIAQYLKDKYNSSFDDITMRLCNGSIEMADRLMTNEGLRNSANDFAKVFKEFIGTDKLSIYKAAEFFEKEKDKYNTYFDVMSIMLSDFLFEKDNAPGVNKGAMVEILDNIEKTKGAIARHRNYNIAVNELLLGAWRALHG
ncbi:MAG: hypothetical protein M0R40_00980 [Firmicutes bacterium]|nr:hypothetical protein [Bacillota bacterium]